MILNSLKKRIKKSIDRNLIDIRNEVDNVVAMQQQLLNMFDQTQTNNNQKTKQPLYTTFSNHLSRKILKYGNKYDHSKSISASVTSLNNSMVEMAERRHYFDKQLQLMRSKEDEVLKQFANFILLLDIYRTLISQSFSFSHNSHSTLPKIFPSSTTPPPPTSAHKITSQLSTSSTTSSQPSSFETPIRSSNNRKDLSNLNNSSSFDLNDENLYSLFYETRDTLNNSLFDETISFDENVDDNDEKYDIDLIEMTTILNENAIDDLLIDHEQTCSNPLNIQTIDRTDQLTNNMDENMKLGKIVSIITMLWLKFVGLNASSQKYLVTYGLTLDYLLCLQSTTLATLLQKIMATKTEILRIVFAHRTLSFLVAYQLLIENEIIIAINTFNELSLGRSEMDNNMKRFCKKMKNLKKLQKSIIRRNNNHRSDHNRVNKNGNPSSCNNTRSFPFIKANSDCRQFFYNLSIVLHRSIQLNDQENDDDLINDIEPVPVLLYSLKYLLLNENRRLINENVNVRKLLEEYSSLFVFIDSITRYCGNYPYIWFYVNNEYDKLVNMNIQYIMSTSPNHSCSTSTSTPPSSSPSSSSIHMELPTFQSDISTTLLSYLSPYLSTESVQHHHDMKEKTRIFENKLRNVTNIVGYFYSVLPHHLRAVTDENTFKSNRLLLAEKKFFYANIETNENFFDLLHSPSTTMFDSKFGERQFIRNSHSSSIFSSPTSSKDGGFLDVNDTNHYLNDFSTSFDMIKDSLDYILQSVTFVGNCVLRPGVDGNLQKTTVTDHLNEGEIYLKKKKLLKNSNQTNILGTSTLTNDDMMTMSTGGISNGTTSLTDINQMTTSHMENKMKNKKKKKKVRHHNNNPIPHNRIRKKVSDNFSLFQRPTSVIGMECDEVSITTDEGKINTEENCPMYGDETNRINKLTNGTNLSHKHKTQHNFPSEGGSSKPDNILSFSSSANDKTTTTTTTTNNNIIHPDNYQPLMNYENEGNLINSSNDIHQNNNNNNQHKNNNNNNNNNAFAINSNGNEIKIQLDEDDNNIIGRDHQFVNTIKMPHCEICTKRILFNGLKCRLCKIRCHKECRKRAPRNCLITDLWMDEVSDPTVFPIHRSSHSEITTVTNEISRRTASGSRLSSTTNNFSSLSPLLNKSRSILTKWRRSMGIKSSGENSKFSSRHTSVCSDITINITSYPSCIDPDDPYVVINTTDGMLYERLVGQNANDNLHKTSPNLYPNRSLTPTSIHTNTSLSLITINHQSDQSTSTSSQLQPMMTKLSLSSPLTSSFSLKMNDFSQPSNHHLTSAEQKRQTYMNRKQTSSKTCTLTQIDSSVDSISIADINRQIFRYSRTASLTSQQSEWSIPYEDIHFKEEIGRGHFGSVYRAKWHGEVAVKCLKLAESSDENESSRQMKLFQNEIAILRTTRHLNLVLFYGACTDYPNLAIVTSLARGSTLYKLIHLNKEQLTAVRSLQIALQISQALAYLHSKQITHKNLKSSNVFVQNYKVLITDYGLFSLSHMMRLNQRRYNHGLSRRKAIHLKRGWLTYLAPEIIKQLSINQIDENIDNLFNQSIDVFAFGTILYELLYVDYPYGITAAPESIVYRVGNGQICPIRRATDVPYDLCSLLFRCWNSDPDERPNFVDILNILDRLQEQSINKSRMSETNSIETIQQS
ncbi:hypothetical protein SNEBB_007583 [Seison nebaliae]|nr:hypothetical protein SNEBB_007583 [Seison nebaliae]